MIRPLEILVVDDNELAAKSLQKLLTLRGHTVSAVFSGQEAISHINSVLPAVVLLDIGLPDMTGYEVAQKLREEHTYAGTLIALTGYGQENDKRFAENSGFDFHLTKPAGLTEIEEILEKISSDTTIS